MEELTFVQKAHLAYIWAISAIHEAESYFASEHIFFRTTYGAM